MTVDEAKEAISELKAQGSSEEEIAGAFYLMFTDGKIDVNQFNALVNLMGYHLSDEFLAMDEEQQKSQGFEKKDEAAEGVTEGQVEDAKDEETNPFDGNDDKSEPEAKPEEKENDNDNGDDDEEDEESKAMKLFGK